MEKEKSKEMKVVKSSLINIDSAHRNIYPKNITTNNKLLSTDPINLVENNKTLTINYINHNLAVDDMIVIQNVTGISKTLTNYFFLINNFNYCMIIFKNNMIGEYVSNTINLANPLYAMIEIVGNMTESNIINNIPFNLLYGYKQTLIKNDIPISLFDNIKNKVKQIIHDTQSDLISYTDTDIYDWINKNCLFIQLPYVYINNNISYYIVNQVFKITYQHIGGIPLGYINSNFPISNLYYQSNQTVATVPNNNSFTINLYYSSYGNIIGGGKNIQIMKIINSITGYPNANNYVINLKKSFNNIIKIDLLSMELPYIDLVVTKNVNDKLYWKHIEDGNNIYHVTIDEGFYSNITLQKMLLEKMNLVPRVISTVESPVYNHFDITLETNIMKIIFKPYNLYKIPNALSINIELINNIPYYILNITQNNNFVNVGDTIIISDASGVSCINNVNLLIDRKYINGTHIIYSINSINSTYNIILGKQAEIQENALPDSALYTGGDNTKVKLSTKVSMLFNKPDTIGYILGFLNVGSPYSITYYNSIISNMDPYIIDNNMNVVGNELSYSNNFINLSGNYNYVIMYLNNLEYIYFNNSLNPAFAKILLNGNPGDILFNTFVPIPENLYCKSFPISSLSEISVSFLYPDGSPVNFRNINHSFTLKITEEHIENDTINLNSQNIKYYDEYKNVYMNK
jgi:hypothetical protein